MDKLPNPPRHHPRLLLHSGQTFLGRVGISAPPSRSPRFIGRRILFIIPLHRHDVQFHRSAIQFVQVCLRRLRPCCFAFCVLGFRFLRRCSA